MSYMIENIETGSSFGAVYLSRAAAERALARAMRLSPLKGSSGWRVASLESLCHLAAAILA